MLIITRSTHPHLWSVFALVGATFGHVRDEVRVTDGSTLEDLSVFDDRIGHLSVGQLAVLTGVVDDDAQFDELLMDEACSFVNHHLSM